jgi:hypothetical protein
MKMNSSASDKLTKQIDVELMQLVQHYNDFSVLIEIVHGREPTRTEVAALAAFLHSLYTGIENIFTRIYIAWYGRKLEGEAWHKKLLQLMHIPEQNRPAVISEHLFTELNEYRSFRHVFRQAYNFDLRWEMMKSLVFKSKEVMNTTIRELSMHFAIKTAQI